MNNILSKAHRDHSRKAHNEEFFLRLIARRADAKRRYDEKLTQQEATPEVMLEGLQPESAPHMLPHDAVLETIVREERPVLFVNGDWIDVVNVTKFGPEAEELVDDLSRSRSVVQPLMPLVGRIDVTDFPSTDYVGTGWFVDTDIVVTNRHVAQLIARWDGRKFTFARGVGGRAITSSLSTLHEFDDVAVDQARAFSVIEVLYIEPDSGPDIAFLKVARRTDGSRRDRIPIAAADVGDNIKVVAVGYPARASKSVIPNQQLMKDLYRDRYDVKRAAPGLTMSKDGVAMRHDCTTLGGNSGSVVLNLTSGEAVGLHFAGLYQEANFAVRATTLSDYVKRKRWNQPVIVEQASKRDQPPARPQAKPQAPAPMSLSPTGSGAVTVTIPLSITVSLGQPLNTAARMTVDTAPPVGAALPARTIPGAEAAVKAFWNDRPQGVIAARVGFHDDGEAFGDEPFIAASVSGNQLDAVAAAGPTEFQGYEVHYLAANMAEQIDNMPGLESVNSISYDDDARTGTGFSFDAVNEAMTVRAHVGPEYSWEELDKFLAGARRSLVSAMYEFHAPQIKDAIEARLTDGVSLSLVMDNSTFSKIKDPEQEFDRIPTFERWKRRFKTKFDRIVAPEGTAGLISDSYHIKVTVREDDTFWLSSGNWKKESSQPVITQEERDNATVDDLPGNREWHVVIGNKTLADRFRNHIQQDFKRSRDLGGGAVPPSREAADIFVDVPVEEAIVLERRPPNRLLKPLEIDRKVKVKPLLTPDREGKVYSQAVLDLIQSARDSLLFQIPYIGMPSNPNDDRGFIDELINSLTQKLKTLRDARVILRVGGSRFSDPRHAAWFFKSKGVDIEGRLRQIENHHTKGMIVDGKRVLLGSHNWSKPGVTLNRDASLIFDDEEIAGYYAEAFEIDWARSNPIQPKRFVREAAIVQEAVGSQPPQGYKRVRLSETLTEDD